MKRGLPGLAVPADATPAQRPFFLAVIERLQVASGEPRAPLDRAITARDLADAGLANVVIKSGIARLRPVTDGQSSSSSSSTSSTFSTSGWDVIDGQISELAAIQVLALDAAGPRYVRIPTEYLAPLLGLVSTTRPQDIMAPWSFQDTVEVGGEHVVTSVGHGLEKTDDFTLAVVDAELVINWSQLEDVPTAFPPEAHDHDAADIDDTVLSPTQLAADTHDYTTTGIATASVLRMSTDASRNLTGMVPGIRRTIINIGANNLVIKRQDAGSVAANRFAITADITLLPDGSATFFYDTTSTRWRCVAVAT